MEGSKKICHFQELPQSFTFVHNPPSLIRLKAAFAILQIVLEAYAFWIARRCYSYAKFTADTLSACCIDEKPAPSFAMSTNGYSMTSTEFHEMRHAPPALIKSDARPPQPSPLSIPTIHGNGSTSANAARLLNMQPQTDC
ncbi:hypothetical protein PMAYCL1PPCAC_31633 [Pristionchus mayeri]|uniref:Uncharacterized protein n=1 Tax=Pristionchus mayeri TaxID=1317129 RepID=A0AAN5ICS3_9BILA|nr:hypothetical protein PMAYCL1PPCAC_31633 [Pristionchus mayeri]